MYVAAASPRAPNMHASITITRATQMLSQKLPFVDIQPQMTNPKAQASMVATRACASRLRKPVMEGWPTKETLRDSEASWID